VKNFDNDTVNGFGREWSVFDQSDLSEGEKSAIFESYFTVFPWHDLPRSAVGADIGCGSGRWASLVAPRVGELHCIDMSQEALSVAQKTLAESAHVHFHQASVDAIPIPDGSLDFAYSLGVLHHVPDTAAAIRSVAAKLRSGAPFLIYLYYAFDNRPPWYRLLWKSSDWVRSAVARMPFPIRYGVSQLIAAIVYWPLARAARFLRSAGRLPRNWPLAHYIDRTFYVMRTDALDRFGTKLERRYTRLQIAVMLEAAGFVDIRFSESPPYWCAVAIRR